MSREELKFIAHIIHIIDLNNLKEAALSVEIYFRVDRA